MGLEQILYAGDLIWCVRGQSGLAKKKYSTSEIAYTIISTQIFKMRRSSTASLPCLIVFLRRYLYYGLIAIQVVLIDQVVVGEATGPLLGGKYTPTTDVDAL